MRRPDEGKPCWATVNGEALHPRARLARVLVEMGFNMREGAILLAETKRGDIAWWQPDYLRMRRAGERDVQARVNRNLRDSVVLAMARPVKPEFRTDADGITALRTHEVYLVDTYDGEWRSADGAQRGDDLLTMGMLFWSCRYGQAGARIARVCGFRVPVLRGQMGGMARAA